MGSLAKPSAGPGADRGRGLRDDRPGAALSAINAAARTGQPRWLGRSRWQPTSLSRWRSWPSSAGRCRPSMRAFLLTLAIVDDLGAIIVIATVFTDHVVAALAARRRWLIAGLWWLLQNRRVRGWWWWLPLGLLCWWCMYQSGVHPTIAGVLLGLLTRGSATDPTCPAGSLGASAGVPSRPAWPCRCSPCSPPVSRSPWPALAAPARPTRRDRHHRRPGRRQDHRHLRRVTDHGPVHPRRAGRRPAAGARCSTSRPRRRRLHRRPAGRRARLRQPIRTPRSTPRPRSWSASLVAAVLAAVALAGENRAAAGMEPTQTAAAADG